MLRSCAVILVFASVAHAQADDDLAKAFDPQPELKIFEPEHNVPPPPPIDDPNEKLRATFETDFEAAKKKLWGGDVAGARSDIGLLELSAFVLGGPERVRVQQLAREAAIAAKDRGALDGIDAKWVAACGPNDVEKCRSTALDAMASHDPARAEAIRGADQCVLRAEKAQKPADCLASALTLFRRAEDTLMVSRIELINALATDPKQAKAAKKALTKIAETLDGRNGHVRRAAFDARAKIEAAEGKVKEAATSAIQGAEALASTMPLQQRYWARTPMVEETCAAYDLQKGRDACRQIEKQVLGFYVFRDFSLEHLPDRQLIPHATLLAVDEEYGVLIRECLAREVRQIADKAMASYLVQWLVIRTGRVDNFHSLSSELDQSRFVTCLRDQFGYWRYPTHEADPQRVNQGFSVKSRMRVSEETEAH